MVICSNGKISGGKSEYNFKTSIKNFLSKEAKNSLVETREFNFQHIIAVGGHNLQGVG